MRWCLRDLTFVHSDVRRESLLRRRISTNYLPQIGYDLTHVATRQDARRRAHTAAAAAAAVTTVTAVTAPAAPAGERVSVRRSAL